jgi:hypothetical protein
MIETRDARLMQAIATRYAHPVVARRADVARYLAHINGILYVPAAYLHCGIKGAQGDLAHYGAAADVRDALALELL